jgi:GNAT superfamily N-acetyltransferase
VGESDRPTVAWLMMELWGSTKQVVHGTVFRPADLPGLIAERDRRLAGVLTYNVAGGIMEVVTLNALERRAGVGTLLMDAAAVEARRLRCTEIRLTTTNDNLDALRFYQRRGLRLVALRPGAVDRARVEKPEIPRVGDYGIPLHDEIDLARRVLYTPSIRGAEKPRMRHQTRHYCEKNFMTGPAHVQDPYARSPYDVLDAPAPMGSIMGE